ncbi:MAG: rhodanese-like domain-containing protein [Acidimicrobiales bacterium]
MSAPHRELPITQAQELAAQGAQLVDVREANEVAAAALEGIIHIPLGDIPARMSELDATRTVALICRSGNRSGQAAAFLAANGFDDVINLTGGMMALGLQS